MTPLPFHYDPALGCLVDEDNRPVKNAIQTKARKFVRESRVHDNADGTYIVIRLKGNSTDYCVEPTYLPDGVTVSWLCPCQGWRSKARANDGQGYCSHTEAVRIYRGKRGEGETVPMQKGLEAFA